VTSSKVLCFPPSKLCSIADLVEYVGDYASKEICLVYRIVLQGANLNLARLKHTPQFFSLLSVTSFSERSAPYASHAIRNSAFPALF